MTLIFVIHLESAAFYVQFTTFSQIFRTLIQTNFISVKMNTSTYPSDNGQEYDPVYPEHQYYEYPTQDTQQDYSYPQVPPYEYNNAVIYPPTSEESRYSSSQFPIEQDPYGQSIYNPYEVSDRPYVPEYPSNPHASSSSDMVSDDHQLGSSIAHHSTDGWGSNTGTTGANNSLTTTEYPQHKDRHSSKQNLSKGKSSKNPNVRTPRKSLKPPAEFTSVFEINPDKGPQRKSRKTFTDEEKRKVEAVRSIGACGPCRQSKRNVSFLITLHAVIINLIC